MKNEPEVSASAVLIAAPRGQDESSAAQLLAQAGIASRICANLAQIAGAIGNSTLALILGEEALTVLHMPVLLETLRRQPRWSDIPILILTMSEANERAGVHPVDIFGEEGNVTLLDRPLHAGTFLSAARVALRARQRQYEVRDLIEQREMVLSGISDAFSSLDRDWRYTYVNDRVAELAGMPKEKLIGRKVWEIFPEIVGSDFYQLAHQAMEKRIPVHAELFHQPWGRWLDTRIYPTKTGIVIFRADVTERKQQQLLVRERERLLQENEDLLRLATEAAGIGTFDFYPKTGEVRWSERCKELFGLPSDAPVNYDTYIGGVHPEDRHIVHETVQNVLQSGSSGRFDIEYRTIGAVDKKERWVTEKGRVLLGENGEPTRFIGTILEITDRKNAEILLQRAKQEAEEANNAKDQFLAMLSHELRTPLTPVLMTITALRRQPEISDDLRDDLEMLQRNVELEARLIDDLLDLTRIAHGKLELRSDAVDIHAVLDHAIAISSAELEQKKVNVMRSARASLLGGRRAAAAGFLESDHQRSQVHTRRRTDRADHS